MPPAQIQQAPMAGQMMQMAPMPGQPQQGVQMMPMMMPVQSMGGSVQMAAQQGFSQVGGPPHGPPAAPPAAPAPQGFQPSSPTSPPPTSDADAEGDEQIIHDVARHPDAAHAWSAGRQLFGEALDTNTVDGLSADGQIPPSKGSSLHGTGRCSPCAWFWKQKGCQNGPGCDYCHLCPEGELKNRKKQKVAQIRQGVIDPSQPKGPGDAAMAQNIHLSTLL
jgi:hypothetical protein